MRRFSDKHQLHTLSELNVTPLLDLAFVLLVIFMITTPLMENSSELIVPTAKASEEAALPEETHTLSIDKNLDMILGEDPVTTEDLEATLLRLKETHANLAIVVRAHKELSVQTLVDVMETLKRVGITKIGVKSASADGAL